MHNRKELLKTIKEYHNFMYYCTNGAHNYSCRTLIDIFNELESNLIGERSQVFITRENKYINTYCNINDLMEV